MYARWGTWAQYVDVTPEGQPANPILADMESSGEPHRTPGPGRLFWVVLLVYAAFAIPLAMRAFAGEWRPAYLTGVLGYIAVSALLLVDARSRRLPPAARSAPWQFLFAAAVMALASALA